jgi:hypothetical protein
MCYPVKTKVLKWTDPSLRSPITCISRTCKYWKYGIGIGTRWSLISGGEVEEEELQEAKFRAECRMSWCSVSTAIHIWECLGSILGPETGGLPLSFRL